jgi:hypothetical protein
MYLVFNSYVVFELSITPSKMITRIMFDRQVIVYSIVSLVEANK